MKTKLLAALLTCVSAFAITLGLSPDLRAAAGVAYAEVVRAPLKVMSTLTVDGASTLTGAVTMSSTLALTGALTLANGESLNTATDDTFDFTRDDAGIVTLTCSDNDATCAMTVLPGGAAAMILGGASMTSLTVTTDGTGTGEVVLPLQSIAGAELVNDTVDGAQIADTIDLDATLAITAGAAEAMTINKTATDATSENGLVVNYTASDTTSGTVAQYASYLNNAASTEGADALLVLDNNDADDNVAAAVLVLNPTRFTSHFDVGNAAAVFGQATVDSWTFTTDGTGTAEFVLPAGSIDGTEILDATVAGADMVNDTVDGAQIADTIDLDATLAITAGAAEAVTINKTATDATSENGLVVNYTASDTTSGTVAQYASYVNNVASTEGADALLVLDNSDADDNVAAAVLVLNPTRFTSHLSTGTAGITIGAAATTAITLTTDGTGTGEIVLSASSIDATEIVDVARSLPLPLTGWYDCTTKTVISIDDAADAQPDIAVVQSGLVIAYDVTGGSVDTNSICTSFTVPPDYASVGAFEARVTQGAATVTNIETFSCDVSYDGAALVGANAGNLVNQTAIQSATATPVVTYVAGGSVAVLCKQGNASADDIVNIHSIQWTYTATQ